MSSESEIHNFKKIFLDEMGCLNFPYDETIEKFKNMNTFELMAYSKDKINFDTILSPEEVFRNEIRLGVGRIKQKQHKGTNGMGSG